jgi:hypothetical protein
MLSLLSSSLSKVIIPQKTRKDNGDDGHEQGIRQEDVNGDISFLAHLDVLNQRER